MLSRKKQKKVMRENKADWSIFVKGWGLKGIDKFEDDSEEEEDVEDYLKENKFEFNEGERERLMDGPVENLKPIERIMKELLTISQENVLLFPALISSAIKDNKLQPQVAGWIFSKFYNISPRNTPSSLISYLSEIIITKNASVGEVLEGNEHRLHFNIVKKALQPFV